MQPIVIEYRDAHSGLDRLGGQHMQALGRAGAFALVFCAFLGVHLWLAHMAAVERQEIAARPHAFRDAVSFGRLAP